MEETCFRVVEVTAKDITFEFVTADDQEHIAPFIEYVKPGIIIRIDDMSLIRQKTVLQSVIREMERSLKEKVWPTTGYPLIDILFGLKAPAPGTKPVTLIQGPPGTGKTTVIIEIDEIFTKGFKFRDGGKPGEKIREFYNPRINEDPSQMAAVLNSVDISNNSYSLSQAGAKPKISILNVSQSNGAVNNLGERLLLKENVPFARVGNVKAKISKKLIPNWEDREKLLKQFGPSGSYIINGTNNGLRNDMYLKKYPGFVTFDVVIEDESPKSSVPETLLIASMARKKLIKLGDHKQLPSFGLGDESEKLVENEIDNGLRLEKSFKEIFTHENRKIYRTSLLRKFMKGMRKTSWTSIF